MHPDGDQAEVLDEPGATDNVWIHLSGPRVLGQADSLHVHADRVNIYFLRRSIALQEVHQSRKLEGSNSLVQFP